MRKSLICASKLACSARTALSSTITDRCICMAHHISHMVVTCIILGSSITMVTIAKVFLLTNNFSQTVLT